MDKDSPIQAPHSRLVAFGSPWHGSILGPTLTLPDASTRTVPVPQVNDVFDFHVPGAPGSGGASAPTGGAWHDYLLLYGNCGAIYGKTVSTYPVNWLFARTDGSRWLISLTSAATGIALSGAALTISLRATRFGEFGGTVEVVNFSVTLSDRGLGNSLPSIIAEALPGSVNIGISDIASRGNKCCLMFYALKTGSGEHGTQRYPYGFFEVTLSDSSFSASTATVAYNIADVAGARVNGDYVNSGTPPTTCASPSTYTNNPTVPEIYILDAIMAAWYKADVLTPVPFNYSQPLTAGGYVWSLVGSSPCTGTFTVDYYSSGSSTVTYGSSDFGSYWFTMTGSQEGHGDRIYPDVPSNTYVDKANVNMVNDTGYLFNYVRDLTLPGDIPFALSGTRNVQFTGVGSVHFSIAYTAMSIDITRFHPWAIAQTPVEMWNSVDELNYAPQPFAKRAAANLIIIGRTWVDKSTLDRKTIIDRVITKNGAATISYAVPDNVTLSQISASAHPVTGEVTIGADSAVRAWV